MRKAPIGTTVYIKKSSSWRWLYKENPLVVVGHKKQRSGYIIAVLDSGLSVSFGELTDVPCSTMECGNCKWHKAKETMKVIHTRANAEANTEDPFRISQAQAAE